MRLMRPVCVATIKESMLEKPKTENFSLRTIHKKILGSSLDVRKVKVSEKG